MSASLENIISYQQARESSGWWPHHITEFTSMVEQNGSDAARMLLKQLMAGLERTRNYQGEISRLNAALDSANATIKRLEALCDRSHTELNQALAVLRTYQNIMALPDVDSAVRRALQKN